MSVAATAQRRGLLALIFTGLSSAGPPRASFRKGVQGGACPLGWRRGSDRDPAHAATGLVQSRRAGDAAGRGDPVADQEPVTCVIPGHHRSVL